MPAFRNAAAAVLLAALPVPASAAPADPAYWAPLMTDAYLRLLGPDGDTTDRDTIEAGMRDLVGSYASDARMAAEGPAAFVQAATLAVTARAPATRGSMYDFARDALLTAPKLAGRPADSYAVLRHWQDADPVQAELVPGLVLAQSDVEAVASLQKLAPDVLPDEPAEALMTRAWEAQDGKPVNRILPTRFSAWVAGTEAAWPDLSDTERRQAAAVLFEPAVPPASLLKKVIGTGDVILWLAGVDVPMTDEERAASPELVGFMETGAFANDLRPDLLAIKQAQAGAAAGGDLSAATQQLMRLNNWSAMTGEMSSWESYRYSTQGY